VLCKHQLDLFGAVNFSPKTIIRVNDAILKNCSEDMSQLSYFKEAETLGLGMVVQNLGHLKDDKGNNNDKAVSTDS